MASLPSVAEATHQATRPPVILLEGRLPVLDTPAAQALGLRDGQVIRPNVEAQGGVFQLMLQGQAIAVPNPWQARLAAGERPAWQVQLDARGRAVLTPLAGDSARLADGGDAALAPAETAAAGGRMTQLLLRPPGAPALASLLQPGFLQALLQSLPAGELGAQLARLAQGWPQAGFISPEALRRQVRQAAGGPEAALAGGRPVEPDLKSLLRGLLESPAAALSAATRQTLQESMDDLESRQLQTALEWQAGREVALSLMLPFADAEPVEIRWSRAAQEGSDGRRAPWIVQLHTRSSVFGEVWLQTRIHEATEVDLVMWAEQADLAARAREAGPRLGGWLAEAGLRMTGLQVIHGSRPNPASDTAALTADSGRLIDVRA
jgi:hypothetical protein